MAVGLRKLFTLAGALFVALGAVSQASFAQTDPNEGLYQMLAGGPAAAPVAPKAKSVAVRDGSAKASDPVADLDNQALSGLTVRAGRFRTSGLAPPTGQGQNLVPRTPGVSPGIWAGSLLAFTLGVLALLFFSPLPCLVFGHRRSASRVKFDELEQRWVSSCKRCNVPLIRDSVAGWMVASAMPHKLEVRARPAARHVPRMDRWPVAPEPERVERAMPAEAIPSASNGGYSSDWSVERQNRAHAVVSRLLDDVLGGKVPPPGGRGALFFVVDELRATGGMDEEARRLERISIRMQQLDCALQRGDQTEVSSARRDLQALAGDWMNGRT